MDSLITSETKIAPMKKAQQVLYIEQVTWKLKRMLFKASIKEDLRTKAMLKSNFLIQKGVENNHHFN